MRRGRLLAGLALALLALALLAAVVGAWALTRGAPAVLRAEAERRLSEALETEVRLAGAGLSLRWGLLLEARGVRAWPRDGEPALHVGRLHARPDWWALLGGRVRLGWLHLEDAHLTLARGGGGLALGARPPAAPEDAARDRGEDDARALLAAVEDALHAALGGGLPVRSLRLSEGRIELHESGPGGARTLVLAEAEGRAHRARGGAGGSLRLEGRLREASEGAASAPEGHVALRAEHGGERALSVELDALPLSLVAPWARALGLAPGLAGRVSGRGEWRWEPAGPHRLEAALEASSLRLPLAAGAAPLRRPAASLELELRVAGEALRLQRARVRTGALEVRAEGRIGLPIGGESPVRLRLATEDLPLSGAGALAAALPPPAGAALEAPLARLEAGRLAFLTAELDTTWAGARAVLESGGLARPGALALRARVEDAALRVAVGERLHGVTGELVLDDGTLRLEVPSAHLDGSALPQLAARFRGLGAIGTPEALRCPAPPPVPGLPGWRVLQEILTREPEDAPEREEGWRRIGLRIDRLAHPALLCELTRAAAEITPAGEDRLAFELSSGRWAGLSLHARGRYAASPAERLELEVELGADGGGAAARRTGGPWARGAFSAEITRAGDFRARRAEGRFRAEGERLLLERAALHLDPGGVVRGELALDLEEPSAVPYRARLELADAPIEPLLRSYGETAPGLSGRLSGAGAVQGRLAPGRSPIAGARGTFSLHAREGVLRRELPLLFAIAVASEGWNPFREEDVIAYRALDVVARLEEGHAVTDAVALDAPRLRAAGSGRVALEPPHRLEGLAGLYFFRTLDTLLGQIPVLNRAILGEDRNLLGAYFELSGPWAEPTARLVPVKTVATGPASILLEGVPDLFAGSVRRLQSVLVPGEEDGGGAPPEPGAL